MRVEFQTTEYQFSHSRMPRGFGSWAFQVGAEVVWAHQKTYSEAKKVAAAAARAAGVTRVQVLP